jgi:HK97 family phage prohead protease
MFDAKIAEKVAAGTASLQEMDSLGAPLVAQIKTCGDIPQYRCKAAEPISVNEDRRTISYLVSDETPDRMGDVIRVKGWDLSNYKANPVILWAHDGKNVPPIGRGHNVRRRFGPNRLTADIEFAPSEAHEFAETIYQLAKRGFIKATSVGFMPKGVEQVDEEQRAALGIGPYGQVFSESELMEISVVSVPANPSALEMGVKSLMSEGMLERRLADRFFDVYPANAEEAQRKIREACRSFVDFGAIKAEPGELKVGDMVEWNSSGGKARGKIERVVRDGQIDVPDSDFTITGTEDDPAALIQLYAGDEPTDRRVGHKFSTLTKVSAKGMEKGPACRQPGESEEACVSRKVPELIDEGMESEQAVAAANSMCEQSCSDKEKGMEIKNVEKLREAVSYLSSGLKMVQESLEEYSDEEDMQKPMDESEPYKAWTAMSGLLENQSEQTRATRQLVDALTDLTVKLREGVRDGSEGDCGCPPSDAQEPDVVELSEEDIQDVIESVSRGFAERVNRRESK